MNCFLLPITTCQEIEKATARFFWGSTIEDRKCHWARWETLTTPKAGGGIGFRELHFFNLAMLAKQVWGLLQHPESVTYRILKARYFPRSDLLDANLGFKPSFLWRSLLAAKPLIEAGMTWRIGDGKLTRIVHDRWIGVSMMKRPEAVYDEELQQGTVEMIIDERTANWKRDLITSSFTTEDTRAILAMPLGQHSGPDRRIWEPTKHGFFTVKTAYHLAVKLFSKSHSNRASSGVEPKEWKKMWKICTIPRAKVFLWRTCTNSLPTKNNLCKRGIDLDLICVLCGSATETIDHLLVNCSVVAQIWYRSVLRIDVNATPVLSFKDMVWTKLSIFPSDVLSLIAFTAWEIWKTRNDVCFENKEFVITDVIARAYTIWSEYTVKGESTKKPQVKEDNGLVWKKPPRGEFKVNCDAAVHKSGKVGLGFILRDEYGNVLLAGKTECMADGSSTLMEALAVRFALSTMKQYHFYADVVESDSKNLVDTLNGKIKPEIYCDIITTDILELINPSHGVKFEHIQRQGNQAAHATAQGPEFISIRHTPEHLSFFVEMNVMS